VKTPDELIKTIVIPLPLAPSRVVSVWDATPRTKMDGSV